MDVKVTRSNCDDFLLDIPQFGDDAKTFFRADPQSGKIRDICGNESGKKLNMIRGVLSALQVADESKIVDGEIDVNGECRTTYEAIGENDFTKVKENCKSGNGIPLVTTRHNCEYSLDDTSRFLVASRCIEEYALEPFKSGIGSRTDLKQVRTLTLTSKTQPTMSTPHLRQGELIY